MIGHLLLFNHRLAVVELLRVVGDWLGVADLLFELINKVAKLLDQ